MTNSNKLGIVAILIAVIALGVVIFSKSNPSLGGVTEFQKKSFVEGLFVGTDRLFEVDRNGVAKSFTFGGGIASLVDANGGEYTLSRDELLQNSVLKFSAGGAGQEVITLNLPNATSTAFNDALPTVGSIRTWIYDASALAAATTTTIAVPTYSVDLIAYTTNDDVIDGAEFARITCWRDSSVKVKCFTSEELHAD